MKCEEARDLLIEYVDNQLSELARRRVDHHLAACGECRNEFNMWTESGRLIQSEHAPAMVRSIVDAVMARILSEEKWAVPIGRRMFTVTARMRRIGASVAVLLLLVCSFAIFANTGGEAYQSELASGGKRAVVSATIEPIEPVDHAADGGELEGFIASDVEAASHEEALQPFVAGDGLQGNQPNYSLILGFLGILVTVLGLSWFTRA